VGRGCRQLGLSGRSRSRSTWIGKEDDGLGAGGENEGARKSELTGEKKRLFQSVGGWTHLLPRHHHRPKMPSGEVRKFFSA
jgi:hypothetical protein